MAERALNLRDWEARAFLDGRKTQVRRILHLPKWSYGIPLPGVAARAAIEMGVVARDIAAAGAAS